VFKWVESFNFVKMRNHRLPTIFKSRQPKSFGYKPRYYNQQKEELLERIDRVQNETTEEGRQTRQDIEDYKLANERRAKRSNQRVFIIAGVIILLIYLYFRYSPNV
jgi:hypothetical protein